MTRSKPQQLLRIGFISVCVVALFTLSAQAQWTTGIGLQATGSACCISIVAWNTPMTASQILITASRNIYISLRGLGKFGGTEMVDGYAGAGINLVFGNGQPLIASPVRSLQLFIGAEISLPFVPPQLAFDIEAAVEMNLNQTFFSYIGSGVHLYF